MHRAKRAQTPKVDPSQGCNPAKPIEFVFVQGDWTAALKKQFNLFTEDRSRQADGDETGNDYRRQELFPRLRSPAGVAQSKRQQKQHNVSVSLDAARIENPGQQKRRENYLPAAASVADRVIPNQPKVGIIQEGTLNPRMLKRHCLASSEFVSEGQQQANRESDVPAPEQQEQSQPGENKMQNSCPVIGQLKWQAGIHQQSNKIGAVAMGISEQRHAAIGKRVPPGNLALVIGLVRRVLQRQISQQLVGVVVIRRDRGRLWIDILVLAEQSWRNVQWCQQTSSPKTSAKNKSTGDQLRQEKPK